MIYPKKDLSDLILEQKANNNLENTKNKKPEIIKNIQDNINNDNNIDENLDINKNTKMNQDYKNVKFQNKPENKNNNINILQNLRGLSNQNIGYGSTLMSNVSYSSFLSFKNKKVKFVNLNTSINQSLINNKSIQDEIRKQEEEDKEKIDKKEQEKMMKNILDRLGGTNDVIKENEQEHEQENNELNNIDEENQNFKVKIKISNLN